MYVRYIVPYVIRIALHLYKPENIKLLKQTLNMFKVWQTEVCLEGALRGRSILWKSISLNSTLNKSKV